MGSILTVFYDGKESLKLVLLSNFSINLVENIHSMTCTKVLSSFVPEAEI
jgi:hypothetical protein